MKWVFIVTCFIIFLVKLWGYPTLNAWVVVTSLRVYSCENGFNRMILNDQLDSHQSKRFNTTFPPAIQQSTLTVKKDQLKQSDSAPNHHMSIFGNNKIQKRSLYAKAQTKKRNEDQTGYYTFTRKTQYDGYSLSNDYKNQSRQLVLFASAESNEGVSRDIQNHIRMYAFFQEHYNFTGIMFSTSPSIIEMCQKMNVLVVNHYQSNKYGMPLIRDLFLQSYHLVNSDYYGYINSDVVLSTSVFQFLSSIDIRVQNGTIPPNLEIAGRVFDTVYDKVMKKNDGESYKQFFRACFLNVRLLRCVDSADYFIFPNSFDFSLLKDAVIGRKKIDNYLMAQMASHRGYLIDSTDAVTAFHLGKKGYKDRKGYSQQEKDDENWNGQYVRGIKSSKGCLRFAKWKPPREGDRF